MTAPEVVEFRDPEGVRCLPTRPTGVGALVLAGSSGRIDAPRARLLAEHGAVAESIRWFGGAGQHSGPWEIPLELFLNRVDLLRRECDRILVLGTSFGAEAALLVGALSDAVACVVAFAPSDVVWAGVTDRGEMTSHWTYGGEALPFVPFNRSWEPTSDPPAYVDLYRQSWQAHREAVREATIPVERIRDLVLVAGGDDQVWPAVAQARRIAARREAHGRSRSLTRGHAWTGAWDPPRWWADDARTAR